MKKALLLALFGTLAAGTLSAQSDVYVDSTAPLGGTGTQQNPYKSLTTAISNHYVPGVPITFWVAGRGQSSPYTDASLPPAGEAFPIVLHDGIRVKFWDVNNVLPNQPPPAVFQRDSQSSAPSCFQLTESNTGSDKSGLDGYMPAVPLTMPDTNQGIEIRDFPTAIEASDGGQQGTPDYLVDGVAFYECQKALEVTMSDKTSANMAVSRVLMRSPSVTFGPTEPLVDVSFSHTQQGSATFEFTLANADIRPGDSGMNSSMIVLRGRDCNDADDTFDVTLTNVMITGESPMNHIPPLAPQSISGAGVEVGLRDTCKGVFAFENVTVRDAKAEGVLGHVTTVNTRGWISLDNCRLHKNGAGNHVASFIAQSGNGFPLATFVESGLDLQLLEGGKWHLNARESHFDDNYRHGVYLDGRSFHDHSDGFPEAKLELCTVLRNGQSLDSGAAGHGLFARLREATIDLEVHRSFLTGNHSAGVSLLLKNAETTRDQYLEVTNSTLSKNQGQGHAYDNGSPDFFPMDTNPISVVSLDEENELEIHVSQATVTANKTPFAVALFGTSNPAQEQLWPLVSSSTMDNNVLNWNGGNSAQGVYTDQAYYPLPTIDYADQWGRIFDATHHSSLGNQGPGMVMRYAAVNFNFYGNPGLVPFSYMGGSHGPVFPDTSPPQSPVIDAGGGSVFASDTTDNRGPGYPRPSDPPTPLDVGAYEVQPSP